MGVAWQWRWFHISQVICHSSQQCLPQENYYPVTFSSSERSFVISFRICQSLRSWFYQKSCVVLPGVHLHCSQEFMQLQSKRFCIKKCFGWLFLVFPEYPWFSYKLAYCFPIPLFSVPGFLPSAGCSTIQGSGKQLLTKYRLTALEYLQWTVMLPNHFFQLIDKSFLLMVALSFKVEQSFFQQNFDHRFSLW